MTQKDSVEFLRSQNLGNEVRRYVQIKVSNFIQEMQHDKEVAEKWFEENINMRSYGFTKEHMYEKILKGDLREGVKKIVLEMFERKYGKPLQ